MLATFLMSAAGYVASSAVFRAGTWLFARWMIRRVQKEMAAALTKDEIPGIDAAVTEALTNAIGKGKKP